MSIGLLFVLLAMACSQKEKLSLDVPEGFATNTLKEFARQAAVEIIFDPESIRDVKTSAVKGEYDPKSALRIMLGDTPLSFVYDKETGAYAIIRHEAAFNKNSINSSLCIVGFFSSSIYSPKLTYD